MWNSGYVKVRISQVSSWYKQELCKGRTIVAVAALVQVPVRQRQLLVQAAVCGGLRCSLQQSEGQSVRQSG